MVRFPFGLKIDLGNKELVLIPNESDELFHCTTLKSADLLLENCFAVKNGEKLLNVDGCNIERKVHTFEELVLLGRWHYNIMATTIECHLCNKPMNPKSI